MYSTEETICCRASIEGKLTRKNYNSLRVYLNQLIEKNQSVIISFESVELMDIHCANLLISLFHYTKSLNKQIIYISKTNPHIEHTLRETGLNQLFSF